MTEYPHLRHTVLDAVNVRGLAEFYRDLLGLEIRQKDDIEDADWLTLMDPGNGNPVLAVQEAVELPRSTWPDPAVPQQLHLDLTVHTPEQLAKQRDRAVELGARQILDRSDDPEEPLYVFTDPEGHPFCIFTAQPGDPDGPPLD